MKPIVRVRNVHKIYKIGQTQLPALNGVNVDMFLGEFCCIVGRSGSGKSTLLNLIAGLEKPSKGTIVAANRRIDRLNEAGLVKYRLENIGFIFQSFNLFPSQTALENVTMPLVYRGVPKRKREARAKEMLKRMGLASHMHHRPTQMSGGQQQRVGIARALVTNPPIIFADEPTGNLDSRTSDDIMNTLTDIVRETGHSLIMVTHDSDIAEYADRVIHILDGKILRVECGGVPVPSTGFSPEDVARGRVEQLSMFPQEGISQAE